MAYAAGLISGVAGHLTVAVLPAFSAVGLPRSSGKSATLAGDGKRMRESASF